MLFSSSAQRWEILKKHVELSIKSQSDTRWESRIKCIKPLRYNLKEVLLALKDLEAISIERKDGRAASETKSLIAHLSKWSFLLSVFIWYDILFQVNKASKILQSYGVSLHTTETEIQATEKFLQNYRTTGYDSAATSAVEIAQELDIDPSFPPSRSGKKRRLFDYQGEEEQRATPELKFKSNFFYPLVDQAIMSIKERFNLLREVFVLFVLFVIFILHSRESELYRYTLDGKSALAWELDFRGLWVTCLPHKGGSVPLSALPKDTTCELAGLFSTTSPKCRAPSREAVNTIF